MNIGMPVIPATYSNIAAAGKWYFKYDICIRLINPYPAAVPKVTVIRMFGNARKRLSANSIFRICRFSMPIDSSMESCFFLDTILPQTVLIKLKIPNMITNTAIPYICILSLIHISEPTRPY